MRLERREGAEFEPFQRKPTPKEPTIARCFPALLLAILIPIALCIRCFLVSKTMPSNQCINCWTSQDHWQIAPQPDDRPLILCRATGQRALVLLEKFIEI